MLGMNLTYRSLQLPLAGRNLLLQELGMKKPRLLVFNKADLAESQHEQVATLLDATDSFVVLYSLAVAAGHP